MNSDTKLDGRNAKKKKKKASKYLENSNQCVLIILFFLTVPGSTWAISLLTRN